MRELLITTHSRTAATVFIAHCRVCSMLSIQQYICKNIIDLVLHTENNQYNDLNLAILLYLTTIHLTAMKSQAQWQETYFQEMMVDNLVYHFEKNAYHTL